MYQLDTLQSPRLCTASAVLSLCLGLACGDAASQATVALFDFPDGRRSLQLRDAPCTEAAILRLYAGDVPDPFFAGVLDLRERVLAGCWYQADGRVFFTDSEGDLLVPPPPVEMFSPANSRLQLLSTPKPR